MVESRYPLLVFPRPAHLGRAKRQPGFTRFKRPAPSDQATRLAPQFQRLQDVLERKRFALQDGSLGIQPEQVLVLETIGTVDRFVNAVRKMPGLEWLADYDVRDIKPEHGFSVENNPDKSLTGQLLLVMTDLRALRELHHLFNKWKADSRVRFPTGLAPFKTAFEHLKQIRPWDVSDRLRETGVIEDWEFRLESDQEFIPFEIELWHRKSRDHRRNAERRIRFEIESLDGSLVKQCAITDIAYHGILGRLPRGQVQQIIDRQRNGTSDIHLLASDEIMYIRPVGQCAVGELEPVDSVPVQQDKSATPLEASPVAALLDGLPLARHHMLDGRVFVDDPDGYEDTYQAGDRIHGTTMASLICHGDLNNPGVPLSAPLYVRPIMKPVPARENTIERIPENALPVDLLHRAVRRMYEQESEESPVAPTVRIINVSIGDPKRPFLREVSPWARLLDWLSWKYQVLFVVSAGNCKDDINIDISTENLGTLHRDQITHRVISAITDDTRNRSILSPAEAINAITVGAAHEDHSGPAQGLIIDPFSSPDMPSVVSRHGPGYRRGLKPEVLAAGGRQVVRVKAPIRTNRTLVLASSTRVPGQKVSVPGRSGKLDEVAHTRGTSNAAALTTRSAVQLQELLQDLRTTFDGSPPVHYDVALIKALLVHSASWGSAEDVYDTALRHRHSAYVMKECIGRFLGYGKIDPGRVRSCTDQRVTVLGFGELDDGSADRFALPVPSGLTTTNARTRLTITLAWITPVECTRWQYRVAHLWFKASGRIVGRRQFADRHAVARGTVQHEVFVRNGVLPPGDEDVVDIAVNCRKDAADIPAPIRYGLAVTLEVAEGIDVPVYQEVRNLLGIRARVQEVR